MNEPTEAQIKEFWERCGVKGELTGLKPPGDKDYMPLGYVYPPIDLNNLFRGAVSMIEIVSVHFSWGDNGVLCWLYTKKIIGKPFHGEGLTEEDAFFWAIWEVIHNDKG